MLRKIKPPTREPKTQLNLVNYWLRSVLVHRLVLLSVTSMKLALYFHCLLKLFFLSIISGSLVSLRVTLVTRGGKSNYIRSTWKEERSRAKKKMKRKLVCILMIVVPTGIVIVAPHNNGFTGKINHKNTSVSCNMLTSEDPCIFFNLVFFFSNTKRK